MATKKKKGTTVEARAHVQRALALSEQVNGALVDALVLIEGDPTENLATAIKALRAIASITIRDEMNAFTLGREVKWARGLAEGALKSINANVKR